MQTSHPGSIVLFDGVCNLCNASVRFILRRDRAGRFRFASLQSDAARALLAGCPEQVRASDSIVLVEAGRCFTESSAALRIARRLDGGWPLLYAFMLVPRPLRDAAYRLVARNRYHWFGRTDRCPLPDPATAERFL